MAYWLLQCNPEKWRIHDFLAAGRNLESWTVKRHLVEVAAGDGVALWLTGPQGGVVGVGHVTGPVFATSAEDADDGYWAPGELDGITHQMPIRMTEYFLDDQVARDILKHDPGFAQALIFRAPQSPNPFPLTSDEWQTIQRRLDDDNDPGQGWDFVPGDQVRRVQLHERFGGNRQSGISPCAHTPNVLIFTEPRSGERYGYIDAWAPDDTFRYTGEGQTGDPTMTAGNKAILNHVVDGKALRLFEGAGGVVRYAGEFQVDPDEPWQFVQARQRDGDTLRNVIRFKLRRLAEPTAAPAAPLPTGVAYRFQDEDAQVAIPTATSPRDPDAGGRGLRTHRRLQNALAAAVTAAGLTPSSPAPHDPDYDLLWFTGDDSVTVVEVKSLTRANEIRQLRMGIGQALDYTDTLSRRHGTVTTVLYLPRMPTDPRWVELAKSHGVLVRCPGEHAGLFPNR